MQLLRLLQNLLLRILQTNTEGTAKSPDENTAK